MASRRKPLEDARRRVNEKLFAIGEQTEFIVQSVRQLSCGVRKTANHLLCETNQTKFFKKYRAVSQELEKCLDDLLLISATVSSPDDKDDENDEDKDDEVNEGFISSHIEDIAESKPEREFVAGKAKPTAGDGVATSPSTQEPLNVALEHKKDESHACESKVGGLQSTETPSGASDGGKSQPSTSCANEPTAEASTTCFFSASSSEYSESDSGKYYTTGSNKTEPPVAGSCKNVDHENDKKGKPVKTHFPKIGSQIPDSLKIQFQRTGSHKTTCETGKSSKSESPVMVQPVVVTEASEKHQQWVDPKSELLNVSPLITEEKDVGDKLGSPGELLMTERIEAFAGDVIEEALKVDSSETIVKPIKNKGVVPCMSGWKRNDIYITGATQYFNETRNNGPQIPPFQFPENQCLEVTVTEIISPSEFWIQQTSSDLDLLMEEMCIFFSKRAKVGDKGGMNDPPAVGDVCCAKFTEDDTWYRAVVTAVFFKNDSVEVLYVDDGNKESLPLSRLRPLEQKFRQLPCQAVCCELSGIQLSSEVNMEKVNDWFKRRVSGETLEAVLAKKDVETSSETSVPIRLYIRPPGRTSSTPVDSLKLEYNIHEMMIREGFSKRIEPPKSQGDSSSLSPASSCTDVQSFTKTDSLLSVSTATSGFHEAPCSSPVQTQSIDPEDVPRDANRGALETKEENCQSDISTNRVPPPVIPVDSDGSFCMLVSHVVNPGEFYVHFITSEAGKLDTIMEEMNRTYKESDLKDDHCTTGFHSPRVGDFCCAKFTDDGNWYRAMVLQVLCSLNMKAEGVNDSDEERSTKVEVFYVDFGNIETVGVENLRDLLPRFMELPAQVVRCSLADVQPLVTDVFEDCSQGKETPSDPNLTNRSAQIASLKPSPRRRSTRKSPRGSRSRPSLSDNAIPVAAGDEDHEDNLLNSFFLLEEPRERNRSRSSISKDIEKRHRTPSLLSDAAVELFERVWSGVARPSVISSWSTEATEYFKSLTMDAKKLIGFVVPWDSQMVNNIVNYCQGTECSLPNLGPVLRLNLYDISGDEDVFINGAMVKANFGILPTVIKEETEGLDMNVKLNEQGHGEMLSASDTPVVKVNKQELTEVAQRLEDLQTSPTLSTNSRDPSSPKSPTLKLMEAWNPMSVDYESDRNAYGVRPDNLNVAITGHEEDRGKICRYYQSKYGCYRGNKCPDKHVQKGLTGHVCVFGTPSFMSVSLPDVGTWVAVRVTAVYDPAHFWVQLPFGKEPLDSQIIKSRSGKETSGEEHLKDLDELMNSMCEFYSKPSRSHLERSLAPVAEGELIAFRYSKDNRWYRGRVRLEKDDKYQVCFVDYGFSDWVDRADVCYMVPDFLHLPFQAVECFLANIKPKCDTPQADLLTTWSKDSRNRFESLTEDKVLVCQILSKGLNETMYVNLFDTAEGHELDISREMIDSGFAEEADFKLTQPLNINFPLELPG